MFRRALTLLLAWTLVWAPVAQSAVYTDPGKTGIAASSAATLKTLGAATSAIANSETIVMQTLLAPGQWQTNGVIRVRLAGEKSGTTDTFLMSVRVGTAGTTADTAITGLSARAIMAAGSRSGGWEYDIALASATSAIFAGHASAGTSGYGASSSTVAAAATTITSAAANPLWVSVSIYSGGTTDTVTLRAGSITMVGP